MMRQFELKFSKDYFKKGDIIYGNSDIPLIVTSVPKPKYKKLFWRILNFLTFKRFFNYSVNYKVELYEQKEIRENND